MNSERGHVYKMIATKQKGLNTEQIFTVLAILFYTQHM